MLKGFTQNGEMVNVLVTDEGKLVVEGAGGSSGGETTINNTSENPVPVNITEKTLNASIQQVGTTGTTINIDDRVTTIGIANFSDTANVSLQIGQKTYQIASSVSVDLPINDDVDDIVLTSTEANTKVQIIIKGVK